MCGPVEINVIFKCVCIRVCAEINPRFMPCICTYLHVCVSIATLYLFSFREEHCATKKARFEKKPSKKQSKGARM